MKILIIRFSSIGDIVLTTPVIRCLKQQLENVEVHFLTRETYLPLLEGNPYVSKLIPFKEKLSEVAVEIRKESYDHIIDLHTNLRTRLLQLILLRRFHHFPKLNLRKWLTVQFKWRVLPDIHIVDRYLSAVKFLGVENDGQGLDYFLPQEESLNETEARVASIRSFVAIVIGAKQFTKRIPVVRVIELCQALTKPVVLLGGKDEYDIGELIVREAATFNVINTCGQLSLNESARVLNRAHVVITGDTGLMHISAGLKKEVISIWGNTIPRFGMSPYFPVEMKHYSHIVENTQLSCRPCTKLGYDACPLRHFKCMMDISAEEILKLIRP